MDIARSTKARLCQSATGISFDYPPLYLNYNIFYKNFININRFLTRIIFNRYLNQLKSENQVETEENY